MIMQLSPEHTRRYYRAIAKNDEVALEVLRNQHRTAIERLKHETTDFLDRHPEVIGLVIGNVLLENLSVENGTLRCQCEHIRTIPERAEWTARQLDDSHPWESEGVWIPVLEAR